MIPPTAALLLWPLMIFAFCRERGPAIVLLVAVLGGYLFLPEQGAIDLPALYELNKISIPAYTALAFAILAVHQAKTPRGQARMPENTDHWLPGWFPRATLPRLLVLAAMIGAVMTVVTNRDAIRDPEFEIFLKGLQLKDAGASVLVVTITMLPMLLARKFLAHPEGQRLLLLGLFIAGMIYVPLVLFEARMSPQLNRWTYGFFAHNWLQHIRGDGFRPIVFLAHGLRVSIFLTAALVVACGLARLYSGKMRMIFLASAGLLFVALVISKSLGALMIAIVLCPIILFFPRRLLILVTAGIVSIAILYPVLRGTSLIPLDQIAEFAEGVNEQRAQSFTYRLNFEDQLLDRTNQRPYFGWGRWGRNLYLGEGDFGVPDGAWIIEISSAGWVGFITRFGLMFFPVILLFFRWKRDGIGMETAIIAAALTVAAIDLIPNSGLTPDKWLLAGALWGRLELGRITEKAGEEVPDPPALRLRSRYARPDTAPEPAEPVAARKPSAKKAGNSSPSKAGNGATEGAIDVDAKQSRYTRQPYRHARARRK